MEERTVNGETATVLKLGRQLQEAGLVEKETEAWAEAGPAARARLTCPRQVKATLWPETVGRTQPCKHVGSD